MAFFAQDEEENDNPCTKHFETMNSDSEYKVNWKFTLGTTETATYCVRFDYNDKYIASSCADGSIKIFNLYT